MCRTARSRLKPDSRTERTLRRSALSRRCIPIRREWMRLWLFDRPSAIEFFGQTNDLPEKHGQLLGMFFQP